MVELHYNRRAFTASLASLLLSPISVGHGQQLARSSLKLGVANKAHLYYLPVTIAERRGHFRDYGLAVAMTDFAGGGESLDALLAGSVDVAVGAYEHTLRAQAMGKDIRAAIELGRFPGIVLAVGKDRTFKSLSDLKGLKIGVTALNSSSYFFVLYLMAKAGLAPGDASFLGVGGGQRAVDAMKAGEIDAISNLDPVITRLQQDGAIRILVDRITCSSPMPRSSSTRSTSCAPTRASPTSSSSTSRVRCWRRPSAAAPIRW
jgi:NitT/TauT family transport system substrate-binding protein